MALEWLLSALIIAVATLASGISKPFGLPGFGLCAGWSTSPSPACSAPRSADHGH